MNRWPVGGAHHPSCSKCADSFIRRDLVINDDDASSLKKVYQAPYIMGLVLEIFGIALLIMCLSIGAFCFLNAGRKTPPKDASLELATIETTGPRD